MNIDCLFSIFDYIHKWNELIKLRLLCNEYKNAVNIYHRYNNTLREKAALKIQRCWGNMIVSKPCNCDRQVYCTHCNEYDPKCHHHCDDLGCANHGFVPFPNQLCRQKYSLPLEGQHYVYKKYGAELTSCRPVRRRNLKYCCLRYGPLALKFYRPLDGEFALRRYPEYFYKILVVVRELRFLFREIDIFHDKNDHIEYNNECDDIEYDDENEELDEESIMLICKMSICNNS